MHLFEIERDHCGVFEVCLFVILIMFHGPLFSYFRNEKFLLMIHDFSMLVVFWTIWASDLDQEEILSDAEMMTCAWVFAIWNLC
jgi:hypothetical protein